MPAHTKSVPKKTLKAVNMSTKARLQRFSEIWLATFCQR